MLDRSQDVRTQRVRHNVTPYEKDLRDEVHYGALYGQCVHIWIVTTAPQPERDDTRQIQRQKDGNTEEHRKEKNKGQWERHPPGDVQECHENNENRNADEEERKLDETWSCRCQG